MDSTSNRLFRAFTLIEMVIVIALLAVAGATVGFHLWKGIEAKRFQNAVGRLYAEVEACRHLSLNMQADWILTLSSKEGRFILEQACPEAGRFAVLSWEAPCELQWNHQPIQKIELRLSATGKVAPSGVLDLVGKEQTLSLELLKFFSITETTKKN